ncbi:MAG: ribulose-phosphate 3-epimerase [Planctomycetota bacterium]|nr:MAG: ribulose-phosphate 3-epimerase [Planctomycetota bacterium]REJ85965.1 MAG: ribulose-phosphate 3-epimerase [Planctomycetota bacterium]REK28507.1 MAG: ribulose-phosphate 3-epimerase [Planctomycetota bacterium]REK29073.1 MAG: ribulose-phosphate 3-epimerase [Planctomycetota bacterium]
MSRQALLQRWRCETPLIAPSMLKCDFGNMHREVELLERAGSRLLHLDVMDGHFVPNFTYGPPVIASWRGLTDVPFDAHLMVLHPGELLDEFVEAGCQAITFHIEAEPDAGPLLERIRAAGCSAGLAVNPDTPLSAVEEALPACDQLLVMSVEPGFGGQSFRRESLEKVVRARELGGPDLLIGIDGGISRETIADASSAGADLFVVGSAIFETGDYGRAMDELRGLAADAR